MALAAGTRLGAFEIEARLGAGGMGEVYRARDTRLDRLVAIKILLPEVADDPERRERLRREARAISTLNHPHICTLYDVGEQENLHFLVMEHLIGDTLDGRLARLPAPANGVPLDEALRTLIEIAEALDAAHRQGIVHRDLKPSNVMLTKAGVKLLDFGLAKVTARDHLLGLNSLATATAGLTEAGSIMGTLFYMSPEQLEGRPVDGRTDIFAFGVLAYELLTSQRAFGGSGTTSIIASILRHEPPPVSTLRTEVSPVLDRVIAKCLAKDPDARWQTARDLADELRWIVTTSANAVGVRTEQATTSRSSVVWATLMLLVGIALGAAIWSVTRHDAATPPASSLAILLQPNDAFSANAPQFALSPDGTTVAYLGSRDGQANQLFLRRLDEFTATALPDTVGAQYPFFSPDGRWLAFFANSQLKKMAVIGGAPTKICDVGPGEADWGPANSIVFSQDTPSGVALFRVSADGGTPSLIAAPDPATKENAYLGPQFLPDGRTLLYTVAFQMPDGIHGKLVTRSLDSGDQRLLLDDAAAGRYLQSGVLVYVRKRSIFATRMALAGRAVTGQHVLLADDALALSRFSRRPWAYAAGTFVYQPGGPALRTLAWVDRTGRAEPLAARPQLYTYPRLSPTDEGRIAVTVSDSGLNNIWVYERHRDVVTQVTVDGASRVPVWMRDGKSLAFTSWSRSSVDEGFRVRSDGSDRPERLISGEQGDLGATPMAWSADGGQLFFHKQSADLTAKTDIWVLTLKDRKTAPVVVGPGQQWVSGLSPDSRWIAFVSDEFEPGHFEVYVTSTQPGGTRTKISDGGATEAMWTRSGREILYWHGDQMMSVEVSASDTFVPQRPRVVFTNGTFVRSTSGGAGARQYDVSADGQHFVMMMQQRSSVPDHLNVTRGWDALVQARLAGGPPK